MSQNGNGSGNLPAWWTMVISAWGMAATTFSHTLGLSEALYPILGMAIMAAPTAAVVKKIGNGKNGGDAK